MSANEKKSTGAAILFFLLGLAALFGGTGWLTLLVPAALVTWFSARSSWRTGPN